MYSRLATKADATGQVKRFFTLTILLLGFAVFFWGLHDKLSLYAPPSAPPPMARAKLLSQSEQPSTRAEAAMPQPPQSVPALYVAFFTALLSLLFFFESNIPQLSFRDFRPTSPPLLPATRLRPPPICACLPAA